MLGEGGRGGEGRGGEGRAREGRKGGGSREGTGEEEGAASCYDCDILFLCSWLDAIRKVIRMEFDAPPSSLVTSPLTKDSRSFSGSAELPRPLSENSFTYSSSRPNSFSTVSSSDSRPSSMREASPLVDEVVKEES